jgi:hypothetical protein
MKIMRSDNLIVRILLPALLLFSFPVLSQDTIARPCGMYKSNSYKRNFYVLADDSNDTLLFKGKPRNIHDLIYFFPDSNGILYDDEAWKSCTGAYKKDFTSDPMACWVGHADYELTGDSIKIYHSFKEVTYVLHSADTAGVNRLVREMTDTSFVPYTKVVTKRILLYSGTYINGKLVLRRDNASMVYTKEHDLTFEKCLECQ